MSDLKTWIYFLVMTAFIVILIRKKALPFLKKKTVPETGSLLHGKGAGPLLPREKERRYEVLAFGTYDHPSPEDFGAHVEARLECELTRLADRKTACQVDPVSMGDMLILFISYEV